MEGGEQSVLMPEKKKKKGSLESRAWFELEKEDKDTFYVHLNKASF